MVHLKTLGARHGRRVRGHHHIKNFAALVTMIMGVVLHVRAEPGGAALQLYLPREAGLHEGIQAVVNRGVGNLGHGLLGADENLVGRGMIPLLDEDVIDAAALGRKTKAAGAQLFSQVPFVLVVRRGSHRELK